MDTGIPLHVVAYYDQEDGVWYARCLDLDILGHGDTPEEATECLRGVIDAHVAYGREHNLPLLRRAPEEYWLMYYQATEKRLHGIHPAPEDPQPLAIAV